MQAHASLEEKRFSGRGLVKLIVPLMIEQLLAVTVGIADTMMVAGVGEHAVSAISLVDSINYLLIFLFSALATGGSVVASQYLGRRDHENACDTARQLVYSNIFISLLLAALAIAFNAAVLKLIYGALSPDVMENAQKYFFLSALSYPFLALYNAGAALFRSMGNSKISMIASLAMNAVNLCDNAVLIYVFKLGVVGAGVATLISRALAAVIVTWLLLDSRREIYLKNILRVNFKPAIVRSILKIGIPSGLENSLFQFGKLLVAGIVSAFGTAAIASNAICGSINSFVCVPGGAIGLALITVVGQCVGADRIDLARKHTRTLMLWAYITTAAVCAVLFAFARPVLGMFNLSEESIQMSLSVIRVFCVFQAVVWPISFPFPNALRAAGDAKFTMWVALIAMWACRVGLSYVFTYVPFFAKLFGFPLMGIYFAMYCDWIVRDVLFIWRWLSGRWTRHKVI